ncbi:MAG: hypothetical protein LBD37_02895 [Treponema sp.]|jgi:hypothetical protein|nr:hypothetical protein [Treponema sp.]
MYNPVPGQQYRKQDFGIQNLMRTLSIVEGRYFAFFTLHNKGGLKNEPLPEGFVWTPRYDHELVPDNQTVPSATWIFYRASKGPFTFHGVSKTIVRHGPTQNKFLF